MKKSIKWANVVLEGGGVKAIALVGALWEAERRGCKWLRIAGTSAGAMVGSLLAAGYSAVEIAQMLNDLDFTKFMDKGTLDKIPLIEPAASIIFELGIFEGKFLEEWVYDALKSKGVTCFKDLRSLPSEYDGPINEGRPLYRLSVIASDISRGRLLILPDDLVEYGLIPDNLPVSAAVRMSSSIPYFYKPVKIPGGDPAGRRTTRSVNYIVDGGLLSNFPVWLFDPDEGVSGSPEHPLVPTFGFKLVGPGESRPRDIKGPVSMLSAIVATMLEAHDERHIQDADFARTIAIPTMGVNTTDFDLTTAQKQSLFECGVEAAAKFFDNWDYRSYTFRHSSNKAGGGNRSKSTFGGLRS